MEKDAEVCDLEIIEAKIEQIQSMSNLIRDKSLTLHSPIKYPVTIKKSIPPEAGSRILDSLDSVILTLNQTLEALTAFAG